MRKTLLLLLFPVGLGCGAPPAPPPLYLGHVAATSGPVRGLAEQETLGIRLAIEELTSTGQEKIGDRPVQVKHVEASGEGALEAQAVRLAAVSRVAAIFGGNTLEEVSLLSRSRVPLLTPLGSRPPGIGELVFATGITPAAQGQALARFAVFEKGVRNMVLLVDERREDARALADAFDREFQKASQEKKGARAQPQRMMFAEDGRFPELAQRAQAAKAQAVLFAGSAQDFQEWRKLGPTAEFQVFFGGDDGALRGESAVGAYVASAFGVDQGLPKTVEFAKRFREAFQEQPDVHAALAYDAIRILVAALRRAQSPTSEALVEELRKTTDFPGLSGPLSLGADQQLRRPVFVGRMESPVFVPLKRYDPPGP